jgi:lauroyl/myristoyl acyltransferase
MSAIASCEWLMARIGPRLPVLARMVADNMRAAGFYDDRSFRAYFHQVAVHLANAARIFHLKRGAGAVDRLARRQVDVDDTLQVIHEARRAGGVLLAPPHTVNFLLTIARINQEVPVHVFLRWSKDQRKLVLKREWCEAAGLQVVMEPASSVSASNRAALCVDLLRSGAVLAITPDIAQKSDEGAPVQVFGRTAYLPTGAAAVAQLADAPIVPLFLRLEGDRQIVYAHPPIRVHSLPRTAGGRKSALQQAMQQWASHFEAFVRACPEAWFLWGDSRWSRVFKLDPEYASPLASPGTDADNDVAQPPSAGITAECRCATFR